MGKYMRKAKITSDVAVKELSQGVRTRAKTLALQRLQAVNSDSSCYLQLRNRRLEKTSEAVKTRKLAVKESCEQNPEMNLSGFDADCGLGLKLRLVNSGSVGSGLIGFEKNEKGCFVESGRSDLGGEEDCFGENCLEVQARERSTRESTPCSLIKGSDSIETPGSSTRRPSSLLASDQQTRISMQQDISTTREMEEFFAFAEQQQQKLFTEKSTRESTPCSLIKGSDSIETPGSSTRRPSSLLASDQQTRISMQQDISTTREMEEFFAFAEQQQQKLFTEKYNFDVLNDLPLQGRYEWVRV